MTFETVGDHVARATGRLKAAGIDRPRREARLLLAHSFGKSVEWLVAHDDELIEMPTPFENAVRRREAREPLSHILGEREFWSLRFQVNASVLDPRPDSETLVAAVLA
ncbi:MAG: hypothetical protein VX973_04745, partial [Pseudomonadota bacterium]|nr:hypothetical protein [Pseudomonadota bacterium]